MNKAAILVLVLSLVCSFNSQDLNKFKGIFDQGWMLIIFLHYFKLFFLAKEKLQELQKGLGDNKIDSTKLLDSLQST